MDPYYDYAANGRIGAADMKRYSTLPNVALLNFLPLPHGHGSFRPTFGPSKRTGVGPRMLE